MPIVVGDVRGAGFGIHGIGCLRAVEQMPPDGSPKPVHIIWVVDSNRPDITMAFEVLHLFFVESKRLRGFLRHGLTSSPQIPVVLYDRVVAGFPRRYYLDWRCMARGAAATLPRCGQRIRGSSDYCHAGIRWGSL